MADTVAATVKGTNIIDCCTGAPDLSRRWCIAGQSAHGVIDRGLSRIYGCVCRRYTGRRRGWYGVKLLLQERRGGSVSAVEDGVLR